MTYDPAAAVAHLCAVDPVMAAIIDRVGPFAMRPDPPGAFHALARAIIFQQLSGASAGAIFHRLRALFSGDQAAADIVPVDRSSPAWDAAIGPFPPPTAVLAVPPDDLRAVGLSRQKVAYLHALATHFAACDSCPAALYTATDPEVVAHLTAIPGVGRWTAEMFLIFHLRRPDVLPVNDLGINRAIQRAYGLASLPEPARVSIIGAPWRPYASVACWYLWSSHDTPVAT